MSKNIKAILEEHASDLTAEQVSKISNAVGENYRSIEEVTKKNDRIAELEEQNATLTEQIGNLEGAPEQIEQLQSQVKEFEKAEQARKDAEAEQAKRDSFLGVFDAAIDGKEFTNDIIRDTIFEKVYQKCTAQAGLDAKSVLDEITKDTDGIWKNPQRDINRLPNAASADDKSGIDAANRKMLRQMFGTK